MAGKDDKHSVFTSHVAAPPPVSRGASSRTNSSQKKRPSETGIPIEFRGATNFEYDLVERLAFGGMGEIWLARQKGDGVDRLVAVKRLLSHYQGNQSHLGMFFDEARLQALLSHPHVVQIYDMGEQDEHLFIAMEYVHGVTLKDLVDHSRAKGALPLAHIVDVITQTCEGLSFAHNLCDAYQKPLQVVHRDINPNNLLLGFDGVIKIIDFGIAQSEMTHGRTETGTIKGKFAYMSPEQSAAEDVDRRSDIFSLGIVLYELLTGENPFHRKNVVLSLEAIQRLDPVSVEVKRADAFALAPIVEHCLAKKKEHRFNDCAELGAALRALLDDGLIETSEEPLSVWLKKTFNKERDIHHQRVAKFAKGAGTGKSQAVLQQLLPSAEGPQEAPFGLDNAESIERTHTKESPASLAGFGVLPETIPGALPVDKNPPLQSLPNDTSILSSPGPIFSAPSHLQAKADPATLASLVQDIPVVAGAAQEQVLPSSDLVIGEAMSRSTAPFAASHAPQNIDPTPSFGVDTSETTSHPSLAALSPAVIEPRKSKAPWAAFLAMLLLLGGAAAFWVLRDIDDNDVNPALVLNEKTKEEVLGQKSIADDDNKAASDADKKAASDADKKAASDADKKAASDADKKAASDDDKAASDDDKAAFDDDKDAPDADKDAPDADKNSASDGDKKAASPSDEKVVQKRNKARDKNRKRSDRKKRNRQRKARKKAERDEVKVAANQKEPVGETLAKKDQTKKVKKEKVGKLSLRVSGMRMKGGTSRILFAGESIRIRLSGLEGETQNAKCDANGHPVVEWGEDEDHCDALGHRAGKQCRGWKNTHDDNASLREKGAGGGEASKG
ncbi:MAG: protein kinase [Deltaproteobacteria bacterium]|nr:protein kinase [Deltaproteobacteria bacterium]